jgi:hypothetical protein
MAEIRNKQTFHVATIIRGHLIDATVSFSPAPPPGVFSALAKFEAERIVTYMVEEEINAGTL